MRDCDEVKVVGFGMKTDLNSTSLYGMNAHKRQTTSFEDLNHFKRVRSFKRTVALIESMSAAPSLIVKLYRDTFIISALRVSIS